MRERGSWRLALGWLVALALVVSLYLVFVYAPTERTMGDIQRMFYWHVATAWNAFLAFFVVFVMSLLYLFTGSRRWDIVAVSSAEIGVMFTTLVLITGPLWARPVWGIWWTWDARLTTTLILWFIYVAYLVLRAAVEGREQQARFAAVFGIIGFVDVPIVYMSIHWWRGQHPEAVITTSGISLSPEMLVALIFSVLTFTALYAYLLLQRIAAERLADEVGKLKERARNA